ncbi:unnamed protein product, partial [Symbiodinium sp. CCMP2592]
MWNRALCRIASAICENCPQCPPFLAQMPAMKKPAAAAFKKPSAATSDPDEDTQLVPVQEMSLDEKIAKWKQTNPEERSAAPDLSLDEWRKVNGRANTAIKGSEEGQKDWEEASTSSGPTSVNKKKRSFLVAFLLDPKFGPGFQKYTQEIVSSNKSKTVLKPETWKELLNRYDESEIHAMMDAAVIYEKVDPRCPGVMKYLDTSQTRETKTFDKRSSMSQGVAKGLKGDSNEADAKEMDGAMIEDGRGGSSSKQNPGDEKEKEGKTKRSAYEKLCDEINALADVDAARNKATGIKTLLDGMMSRLDTMATKGKTSKYWTPKVKKDFATLHNNMKNASDKCKSLFVSKKLKLEAMQELLLGLAEILRDCSNSLTSHGR